MSVSSPNQLNFALPEAERSDVLAMQELRQAEAEITTSEAIYAPESIGINSRGSVADISIVGEISLPIQDLKSGQEVQDGYAAILKLKNRETHKVVYLLQGLTTDESGEAKANSHYVRIDAHGAMLGRTADAKNAIKNSVDTAEETSDDRLAVSAEELWGKGVTFAADTSRDHLTLKAFGHRLFMQETSMNGTRVKANISTADSHVSEHTVHASELARYRNLLDEKGRFANRTVITRDTTVGPKGEATVDIRSWAAGGEAIVVDSEKDPEPYQKLLDKVMKQVNETRAWSEHHRVTEHDVLKAIYDAVDTTMDYDLAYVDGVSDMMSSKTADHRKINLAWYLEDGKGVCRQMALAAAWLGSEMTDRGLLNGRMTAEVNQRRSDNAAHEWARYTAADGEVYIIDPAQKYYGKLATIAGDKNRWEYFRKGEKESYMQRFGGMIALRQLPDTESNPQV